jgi:hypothetical protein
MQHGKEFGAFEMRFKQRLVAMAAIQIAAIAAAMIVAVKLFV